MVDLNGFDATEHDDVRLGPIPAGDYLMMAVSSEWVSAKSGNGEYLRFTLRVVQGEHEGANVWVNLNLKHNKENVVKIAQSQLASLCKAVGVTRPRDSAELHNKALVGRVELQERRDKPGSYSNTVKAFRPTTSGVREDNTTTSDNVPAWKR